MKCLKSGKYVLALRILTGRTQKSFAEEVKVTRPYISQLENDGVDISLSTFIEWCELFEISPNEVFDKKL